jgi:hypothetical protein
MIHFIISNRRRIMRGRFTHQGGLFSCIAPDKRVPANQPLRKDIVATAMFLEGGLILLQFHFVWLAAQRRKSWPRWALAAMLVLSVISLLQTIGVEGMRLVRAIEIVSCALTAVGLYLSFTGNARGWFDG